MLFTCRTIQQRLHGDSTDDDRGHVVGPDDGPTGVLLLRPGQARRLGRAQALEVQTFVQTKPRRRENKRTEKEGNPTFC